MRRMGNCARVERENQARLELDNRATETVYDTPQLTVLLDGNPLMMADNAAYGTRK